MLPSAPAAPPPLPPCDDTCPKCRMGLYSNPADNAAPAQDPQAVADLARVLQEVIDPEGRWVLPAQLRRAAEVVLASGGVAAAQNALAPIDGLVTGARKAQDWFREHGRGEDAR